MAIAATQASSAARRPRIYVAMALVGAVVAVAGFTTTYFIPLTRGQLAAPGIIHLHGVLAFGWVFLFLIQPTLIAVGRYGTHVRLGVLGAILAGAVAVTGVLVGRHIVERDLAAGLGSAAYSSLSGVVTSMAIFLGLVVAAVALRARPEAHKRLMLLATIVVLWPAWFRLRHYFPDVPRPDIWFALVASYSLILLAALRDKLVLGRVHPVYTWVGAAIIIEQSTETIVFGSAPWRRIGEALYGVIPAS